MKLIKVATGTGSTPSEYTFGLSAAERRLLPAVLDLYPLLNSDFHRLSRGPLPARRRGDEELLKESMIERRREFRKQLDVFLQRRCWHHAAPLAITEIEIDWLLQVLNDLRVGSWTLLGQPTDTGVFPELGNPLQMKHFTAMEVAGHWQSYLLAVLEGSIAPES
ncbi:MAG: hypothetical protein H7X97_08715 [Opitutaceae bacterium]|nr:hypothetical protein [Verrucomicrobiales bacterium]